LIKKDLRRLLFAEQDNTELPLPEFSSLTTNDSRNAPTDTDKQTKIWKERCLETSGIGK
jgi:hypothetical protein